MKRDEAAITAVIAQLPSVIQGVINLQRDARIAAELLTERIYTPEATTRCYPLALWMLDKGTHDTEWYAGFQKVIRMYQRVAGERNCRGSKDAPRIRIVTLRYVTEVLYGPGYITLAGITNHIPCYEYDDPIEYPPINLTYEEYIELWKL